MSLAFPAVPFTAVSKNMVCENVRLGEGRKEDGQKVGLESEEEFLDQYQKDLEVMSIERVEDLEVYRSAFRSSMEIFRQSKERPKVERCALTEQIRRFSRAVCANLSEVWQKAVVPEALCQQAVGCRCGGQ